MSKLIRYFLIITFLYNFIYISNANPATIHAVGCSQADIQAAINAASDGDTVMVPAGTCNIDSYVVCGNFNVGLCMDKGITLQGAGIDQTFIHSTIERKAIKVGVQEPKGWRITGFTFTGGNADVGLISAGGTSKSWRIDHVKFSDWIGKGIWVRGCNYGVIDHCIFVSSGRGETSIEVDEDVPDFGYEAWKRPYTPGTANAVYIEDNVFTAGTPTGGASCVDATAGGRFVFRYNTAHNRNIAYHGTDSGDKRGTHSTEIYNNKFTTDCSELMARVINKRSGTSLIFNNTVQGCWTSFVSLTLHRNFTDYSSWHLCDGTQWKVCSNSLIQVCTQDSDCPEGGICNRKFCSENQDTLCVNDSDCPNFPNETCSRYFDGDDNGYPCRDQHGRTTNQELSPVYSWNNSYCKNAADCIPVANAGIVGTTAPNRLQANRDYYNNIPQGPLASRPPTCTPYEAYWATDQNTLYKCTATDTWTTFYTPYPYPHPLVTEDQSPAPDPAPDNTPPVISNGSPTETLPTGTTQTTLSLTTNESATCRYSTTANTSYDSMTNTFSTTGLTSHSTTVTGLQNDQSYTYYARCKDQAGNSNTNDYSISFSVASTGGDEIIPSDRRIDWNPGIPGGIPNITTIYANVKNPPYNAVGNDVADDTSAIQNAINDCPAGQVVYLPEGTYRVTGRLTISKGIVLRGDGPSRTKIRFYSNENLDRFILLGNLIWPTIETSITSAPQKGSNTITVSDATNFDIGEYIVIDQLNDSSFVTKTGSEGDCSYCSRENGDRALGQAVKIINKTGNTLTVDPPLYYSYSLDYSPEIAKLEDVVEYAGLENLYVENVSGNTDRTIRIAECAYCWVKNIESYLASRQHIEVEYSHKCEIRDSYIHHSHIYSSTYSYGIRLRRHTSETLVENNIIHSLTAPIMTESASGNVFGYNYLYYTRFDTASPQWFRCDIDFHGAHTFMNLFEGNTAQGLCADYIHGSASHNTFFRNNLHMYREGYTDNIRAASIDYYNRYMNFVGNVLGNPDITGVYEFEDDVCSQSTPSIYKLGYYSSGDCNPTGNDSNVKVTLLRHGNFDYINNSVLWDPEISNQNLPDSYYLTSKPAFFGELPWPIIGPDLSPIVGTIPAKQRFDNIIGNISTLASPKNLRIEKVQKTSE